MYQSENPPQAFNARQLCLKSVFCFSRFSKLSKAIQFFLLVPSSKSFYSEGPRRLSEAPNVNFEQSPLSFLPCSQFPSFNSFRHVFIIDVACWEYHQIKYNHSRNIQWEMIHYLATYTPNNHEELNKIRVPNHHNNPNAIN